MSAPTVAADFSADLRHRYRLECRWGPGPALPWVMCLRETGAGHPGHPLYLPGRLRLGPWSRG